MSGVEAVGVVFSGGGRVYSFDPAGLELAWNDKVICHTAHGQELGRVVQANHELEEAPRVPLKKVVRRATEVDQERASENKLEARRAMRVFRELVRRHGVELKPVSIEIGFDGSRAVVSYQAETRPELGRIQAELARRLGRRVELRGVGPRECARLCGDQGLCGGELCSRRFPSHEQPVTLRMAKDQELSMTSGRITGLCGRLRCCLAYEHPLYKSFRDRAPRVGRRVETPAGIGVVRGYTVLADTCEIELEGAERTVDVAIDECRELTNGARPKR
jgi:cell fate regulator YaaT (PSP1 superfamily)